MTVAGKTKEAAGFVKEELYEKVAKNSDNPQTKANAEAKAQEGRDLRNEGRVEDGKAPKVTKPGTGHPED